MSGGVDSSVTAMLLAQQDYDLSAVFMRNWDTRDESGSDVGCEWEKDWEDVQQVCKLFRLPCELVDLSLQYWNRVFQPSLNAWESGLTPNADVWCNREVKFGALMEHLSQESPWLATGHYAQKAWGLDNQGRERPMLMRSVDRRKDQTYFLSAVREDPLRKTLFPIGHLTKPEIRELADRNRLPTSQRRESMGICFVGKKRRFDSFLGEYLPPQEGPIRSLINRKIVGKHKGLWNYTIGQNIKLAGQPERLFAARKVIYTNELFVVPESAQHLLECKSMTAKDWQWIWADDPPPTIFSQEGFAAHVQFRHVMSAEPCTVFSDKDFSAVRIKLHQPQQAIAPGQVATIWDGVWCLGSGIITDTVLQYFPRGV